MNQEFVARELIAVARMLAYEELSSEDRLALNKAMEKAVENLVWGLKVEVEVDFDYKWEGRHYRQTETSPEEWPEFEAWNEKAYITPRTNVVLVGRIKRYVLTELLKNRQRLVESPEAIVESPEFVESLQDVIRDFDWTMEDVDCDLPRKRTTCKLVMIPKLVGQVLRIDYKMTDAELEKVMEWVRKNEDEYEDDSSDRDD